MPNRIIKESITTSEDISKLSFGAEVMFYRLMVKADDFGAYYGNVQILLNTLFPLQTTKVHAKNVRTWLEELCAAGLVFTFEHDGKQYIQISNWSKHQRIRTKKHKFPKPDDNLQQVAADCDKLRLESNPIQSESNPNPNPNPIQKEDGRLDVFFASLLDAYPRKSGAKLVTEDAKAELYEAGTETVMAAIENYKRQIEEEGIEKKYIKCAHTFFNGDWKDYLDDNRTTDVWERESY